MFIMALTMAAMEVSALQKNKEEVEFECDTPGGRYSQWSRKIRSPIVRISGDITIKELRRSQEWLPVMNIFLLDSAKKAVAGIRLTQSPHSNKQFDIIVRIPESGGDKLIGSFKVSDAIIPLALSYDSSKLQIEMGSQIWRAELKSPMAEKIQFSCSSGDFGFQNFVIEETEEVQP